ncbi:hypothetical protein [Renibacterium salmoninarum]|uniref:hypothetical protein n=1 Tax=Renibacterium salmoninarum TaxID=1646 RepID=UPI0003019AD0|nr:hypothetical protein [Renibacterium salmoninarum]
MPQVIIDLLISCIPATITAIIAYLAGSSRRKHDIIDQLQEEREVRETQIAALQTRIDAFYTDKHASRIYVASLLDHIWQRKPPPPPDPPAGYIP